MTNVFCVNPNWAYPSSVEPSVAEPNRPVDSGSHAFQRPFSDAGSLPLCVSFTAPVRSSLLLPSFSFQRERETCHGGIFLFFCLVACSDKIR